MGTRTCTGYAKVTRGEVENRNCGKSVVVTGTSTLSRCKECTGKGEWVGGK